jgi:hypothetical protein
MKTDMMDVEQEFENRSVLEGESTDVQKGDVILELKNEDVES